MSRSVAVSQIELLYENKERGRMYAAYALSSVVSPTGTLERVYQAGAVAALIHVLNTSRVCLLCIGL